MARHVKVSSLFNLDPIQYRFYDLSYDVPEGQRVREYQNISIASQMRIEDIAQRGYYNKGSSDDLIRVPIRTTFRTGHNVINVFIHPTPLLALS